VFVETNLDIRESQGADDRRDLGGGDLGRYAAVLP